MSAIELNIVLNKYVAELVLKLSVKYEFNFDEAMASLDVKTEAVVVAKVSKEDAKKAKEDEKIAKKAAKEAKDAAKADKPKRATTGYLVYSKEMRDQVKATLIAAKLVSGELDGDAKLKPQDVVKELGTRWKALSLEEQLVWNNKAKAGSSSDDE